MQMGLLVKWELLVVLTVAAELEVIDLVKTVGMEAPDARKAVRTWKVISFRTVLNP